eukprot:159751-Chlamydomonas_euryale.AAC.5
MEGPAAPPVAPLLLPRFRFFNRAERAATAGEVVPLNRKRSSRPHTRWQGAREARVAARSATVPSRRKYCAAPLSCFVSLRRARRRQRGCLRQGAPTRGVHCPTVAGCACGRPPLRLPQPARLTGSLAAAPRGRSAAPKAAAGSCNARSRARGPTASWSGGVAARSAGMTDGAAMPQCRASRPGCCAAVARGCCRNSRGAPRLAERAALPLPPSPPRPLSSPPLRQRCLPRHPQPSLTSRAPHL